MQFSCAAIFSVLLALPGRTVAVSSQKTADEASGGAGPWLSLLTSSWALAGEPQSEQTQGLDDLAQNLVKLAKDGAPPDESMKQAINSIRNIVNDMKKQVNETNAAAQYEINRKAEFLAACAVPETPALKLPNTQEEVVTCRSEEDPLYKAYELCVSEKARCSNTTACCASLVQPNKYCLNPGVAPSPLQYEAQCDGTSSCKETDIKEKIAFFKGKLDALDAAEKACEDSRAGCQDSYDCVPKQDSWKVKQTSCNEMQTKLEQGYCDHAEALEAAWDKYLLCYVTKKASLTSEELKQEATVPGRHQEWRALLRIDCLLGALEVDDTTTALGKCINTTYTAEDWTHLHLRYPSRLDNFTKKESCSDKLLAPGTEHFKGSMYGKVDDHLYPSTLNTYFCVSGLSTSHCKVESGATAFIMRAAVAAKAGSATASANHGAASANMARMPHARHHGHFY